MTSPVVRTDGPGIRAKIKIGTRGSKLALIQTRLVINALKEANPGIVFEVDVIKSTGDMGRKLDIESHGVGELVKKLESTLLDEGVDLDVHSLKTVPAT